MFKKIGISRRIFRNGAFITGLLRKKIPLTRPATLPPFLRFNDIKVRYWGGPSSQPFVEKCEFIESNLLQLKPVLNASRLIEFNAEIKRHYFSDHLHLLDYIRNQFLPICHLPLGYKFHLCFFTARNSATNAIESLLEMREIKSCSNVEIIIPIDSNSWMPREKIQLPVEAISKWLEESTDGLKNKAKHHKEKRFLDVALFEIENVRQMLGYLEKVSICLFYFI